MNKIRKLNADEIECRVAQCSAKGCSLLLYKTARVDRAILDEVFGDLWQCDFKEIMGRMYGGIAVWNKELKEWLWRWDCGSESKADAEKGQASDCFKRAGFKWGIGIELYTAPFIWINTETQLNTNKKYELLDKYAKFSVKEIGYNEKGSIKNLIISDKNNNEVFKFGNSPTKMPKTIRQESNENQIDADFDIIQGITTFNDMPNLTKYFDENKNKVKDFEAFKTACTRRKEYIQSKGA